MSAVKKYMPHTLPKRYTKSRVHGKKFNQRLKENNEVLNKVKSNEQNK